MKRKTRQRDAILDAFLSTERPLGPAEVLGMAQAVVPKLGIATVYRALKSLVDEEWLQVVELPGEPPRYERAGKHHHHHFRCYECHRLFEIAGCPDDLGALLPPGFLMVEHELILYGRCAECVSA